MMKKHFSFGRLIANDKLMMILSLLLSIAIWFSVISGPANIEERPISVSVTVDLTNSYAYQSGLRVIGEDTFDVKVTVSGKWSVVSKLTAQDLRVRPDLTAIVGPGDVELPLNVSRNSAETDYDILAVTPNTVSVMCDYWQENITMDVEPDVSLLSMANSSSILGDPVLDQSVFPNNKAVISGPKAVMVKLDRLVARVSEAETLSETKQYQVPITALDADGNELDISQCEIENYQSETVTLTVPIWVEREVTLGYTVVGEPTGYKGEKKLSITPPSLTLLGPSDEIDTLEEDLTDLGTVDYSKLSISNDSVTFPLTIPSTIQAIDAPAEAVVSLDTDTLAQKSMSITVTEDMVRYVGDTDKVNASVREQTFEELLLVGESASVNAISSMALTVEVDLGDSPATGTKQYPARIVINGYDDVWVYYGSQATGLNVYVTLE